jgi:hypothetical protein
VSNQRTLPSAASQRVRAEPTPPARASRSATHRRSSSSGWKTVRQTASGEAIADSFQPNRPSRLEETKVTSGRSARGAIHASHTSPGRLASSACRRSRSTASWAASDSLCVRRTRRHVVAEVERLDERADQRPAGEEQQQQARVLRRDRPHGVDARVDVERQQGARDQRHHAGGEARQPRGSDDGDEGEDEVGSGSGPLRAHPIDQRGGGGEGERDHQTQPPRADVGDEEPAAVEPEAQANPTRALAQILDDPAFRLHSIVAPLRDASKRLARFAVGDRAFEGRAWSLR